MLHQRSAKLRDASQFLSGFGKVGLLIDESGIEKKGESSVDLARQYCAKELGQMQAQRFWLKHHKNRQSDIDRFIFNSDA